MKYQTILYTLNPSFSILYKTFLPKKKKVFYIYIIAFCSIFYKDTLNYYSEPFLALNLSFYVIKFRNIKFLLQKFDSKFLKFFIKVWFDFGIRLLICYIFVSSFEYSVLYAMKIYERVRKLSTGKSLHYFDTLHQPENNINHRQFTVSPLINIQSCLQFQINI